jgi:hypothetical protein
MEKHSSSTYLLFDQILPVDISKKFMRHDILYITYITSQPAKLNTSVTVDAKKLTAAQ